MSTLQHLREEMAAIASAARDEGVALVLGGGLGVLLRVESKVKSGAPTLAPIPEARATTDLDLLVSAEVITDAAATKRLRSLLDQRGYHPIPGAENYQFLRSEKPQDYKVDLLAEEPASEADVIADDRRIRPHGYRGLHAHRGREIIALTEATVEVALVPGTSPLGLDDRERVGRRPGREVAIRGLAGGAARRAPGRAPVRRVHVAGVDPTPRSVAGAKDHRRSRRSGALAEIPRGPDDVAQYLTPSG